MVTTSKLKDIRTFKDTTVGDTIKFNEDVLAFGITEGTKGKVVGELDQKLVLLSGAGFTKTPLSIPSNIYVEVLSGSEAQLSKTRGDKVKGALGIIRKKGGQVKGSRPTREQVTTGARRAQEIGGEFITSGRATFQFGKDLFEAGIAMTGGSSKKPASRPTPQPARRQTTPTVTTTQMPRNNNQRQLFLDVWWDISPKTFQTYLSANNSSGSSMINDLKKNNPRIFQKVYQGYLSS